MKRKASIYLVDDDEDDLTLLREAFENITGNIQITELTNGKELLELISHQTASTMPDLIITDVNMPKSSGLDALSILKSDPVAQHIPVIMLSTSNDQTLIKQAYDFGTSAFVIKPTSIHAYNHIAKSISLCFLNNFTRQEELPILKDFLNKSILIIEDNNDQWELMRHSLKCSTPHIKLFRLENKSDSLDFLTDVWNTFDSPPELIILDLYVPTRRDGLNLLDSIHYFFKLHRLAPVPVIILSASNNKEDIDASYQHNASAYMVKDMDTTYSISALQNLFTFWFQTISLPKKLSSINTRSH